MNRNYLRYIFRRLSSFRIDDVVQRLNLKIRHEKIKRRFRKSPDTYTLSGLLERSRDWMEFRGNREEIRKKFIASNLENLGCLNLWSQEVWDRFGSEYKIHSAMLKERGSLLLEGKATIFGWRQVDIGHDNIWRSCFDQNFPEDQWPDDFYWTIDFGDRSDKPGRDVKINWEVNRLQFLLTLGACWRLTGDPIYSRSARSILDSWLDSVIYPLGPQWASNLEVALRSLSLVRCCLIFIDSDDWDFDFLLKVIASIELSLDHLENELTTHHTQGNHLLGESAALWQVSLLCPFLKRSRRRIQKASRILDQLVPRLILADGVYAEQSASYAKFVLEFLIPLLSAKSGTDVGLWDMSRELIRKSLYFLNTISDDNGILPMIGDSDSGSALGFYIDNFWDIGSLLVSGAVALQAPNLCRKVRSFPAESLLFWGDQGVSWYELNCSKPVNAVSGLTRSVPQIEHFPDGGLVKARHKGLSVIFDVGPMGKAPGYEHGHSDGLSVQLWLDDNPLLIDPGTFVYNGKPSWRNYFKGSRAHNVIRLDTRDQSISLGSFRWAFSPAMGKTEMRQNGDNIYLAGTIHLEKAIWTRRLSSSSDNAVLILDEIRCAGASPIELNLVLDPSWSVISSDDDAPARGEGGAGMVLFGWEANAVKILHGDEKDTGGWLSRLYGKLEKTINIRAESMAGPVFYSAILIGHNLRDFPGQSIMDLCKLNDETGNCGKAVEWFSDLYGRDVRQAPILNYRLCRQTDS